MEQEQYLEGTPLRKIILRGIKKLMNEMTSIKFLLLVFICIGIWQKFIQDSMGLGTALLSVGEEGGLLPPSKNGPTLTI